MASEHRKFERMPGLGAKAALSTGSGIIMGTLVNFSENGALMKSEGAVAAGERVILRAQGPNRVWERKGTVVWVSASQGIAIEFDSGNPRLSGPEWK